METQKFDFLLKKGLKLNLEFCFDLFWIASDHPNVDNLNPTVLDDARMKRSLKVRQHRNTKILFMIFFFFFLYCAHLWVCFPMQSININVGLKIWKYNKSYTSGKTL